MLAGWIDSAGNRIRIVETVTGGLVAKSLEILALLPAEERQLHCREIRVRDAGEMSTLELAATIRNTLIRDSMGLVLFED